MIPFFLRWRFVPWIRWTFYTKISLAIKDLREIRRKTAPFEAQVVGRAVVVGIVATGGADHAHLRDGEWKKHGMEGSNPTEMGFKLL